MRIVSMRGTKVFKTHPFSRWAKDVELTDEDLCCAVEEMLAGLVDADLGGGLVKKRIRLAGRGKRGGARVIVATRRSDRWFFVFGFAKNDRESIDHDDRRRLATLARRLIGLSDAELATPAWRDALEEIRCNDEEETR